MNAWNLWKLWQAVKHIPPFIWKPMSESLWDLVRVNFPGPVICQSASASVLTGCHPVGTWNGHPTSRGKVKPIETRSSHVENMSKLYRSNDFPGSSALKKVKPGSWIIQSSSPVFSPLWSLCPELQLRLVTGQCYGCCGYWWICMENCEPWSEGSGSSRCSGNAQGGGDQRAPRWTSLVGKGKSRFGMLVHHWYCTNVIIKNFFGVKTKLDVLQACHCRWCHRYQIPVIPGLCSFSKTALMVLQNCSVLRMPVTSVTSVTFQFPNHLQVDVPSGDEDRKLPIFLPGRSTGLALAVAVG